jgi:hypothetical protein
MTESIYRIVHCADDSFVVEIVRTGVLPQTTTGFATEAEASRWIAQDQRLWNADGPLQTVASRRWRGD